MKKRLTDLSVKRFLGRFPSLTPVRELAYLFKCLGKSLAIFPILGDVPRAENHQQADCRENHQWRPTVEVDRRKEAHEIARRVEKDEFQLPDAVGKEEERDAHDRAHKRPDATDPYRLRRQLLHHVLRKAVVLDFLSISLEKHRHEFVVAQWLFVNHIFLFHTHFPDKIVNKLYIVNG